MPPLERRRRRHPTPAVLAGVAAVLVVAVLVGGLFEVGRGSTSYHRDVNRSYAAQASLLVATSNQQGDQVRALMDDMPGLDRDTLESRLGSLSAASAHLAASATALEPPAPTVGGLATALAERASALSQLRAAVDGLLTLDRAAPLAPPRPRRGSRRPGRCWPGPTRGTRRCAGRFGPRPATPPFPGRCGCPTPSSGRPGRPPPWSPS